MDGGSPVISGDKIIGIVTHLKSHSGKHIVFVPSHRIKTYWRECPATAQFLRYIQ